MSFVVSKTAVEYAEKLYQSGRLIIQTPPHIARDLAMFLTGLGFDVQVEVIPELVSCLYPGLQEDEDSSK